MKVILLLVFATLLPLRADSQSYPSHPHVIDVRQPPYSAKGDGVTDDSEAIQAALNEHVGRHRVIYFPSGTYLISRTLTWPNRWNERNNWGYTMLRGESAKHTILYLKDGTFPDAKQPGAIMWCGGFGSADWFHNHVENLTFSVGANNAGGIALQFYSNNTGAVRDCHFIAAEGSGLIGLDLSHRDMNGPLLVLRCTVTGFRRGITTARAVNSQVFENIRLRGQSEFGFHNEGQPISIRHLHSENSVPALATYGRLLLLNATLTGLGDNAARSPAIINYNGGRIFLRDVKTNGYRRALADIKTPDLAAAWRIEGQDRPGSLGPDIIEYSSHEATTAFSSTPHSLRLTVKETPVPVWDPPAQWAVVDAFGADGSGKTDSADAIQRAMDSGATTVFFPGHYRVSRPIDVRGKVRRVLGISGWMNYGQREMVNFRISDGEGPVFIEHFSGLHGGIAIDTNRPVILRSVGTHTIHNTPRSAGGEVFLEDVVGDDFRFKGQRVWARQLNIENEGTHLTNDGGLVWVLGYKTERGGTLVHTLRGGATEILGGFSYTTTAGKLAPMIVNEDARVWTWFGETCYTGDPFAIIIRETRSGITRELGKDQASAIPYSGQGPASAP